MEGVRRDSRQEQPFTRFLRLSAIHQTWIGLEPTDRQVICEAFNYDSAHYRTTGRDDTALYLVCSRAQRHLQLDAVALGKRVGLIRSRLNASAFPSRIPKVALGQDSKIPRFQGAIC
jgi:hypothetical protein